MSTQPARSLETAPALATPDWLWTWNGTCFGYRREDALFTCDGVEVGRFFGNEIYGVDGRYLGELGKAEDGRRLISSSYKKLQTRAAFFPDIERCRQRAKDRPGESLYCGYEDFPSPLALKATVLQIRKQLKSLS